MVECLSSEGAMVSKFAGHLNLTLHYGRCNELPALELYIDLRNYCSWAEMWDPKFAA